MEGDDVKSEQPRNQQDNLEATENRQANSLIPRQHWISLPADQVADQQPYPDRQLKPIVLLLREMAYHEEDHSHSYEDRQDDVQQCLLGFRHGAFTIAQVSR